jgi:hypothetical protein
MMKVAFILLLETAGLVIALPSQQPRQIEQVLLSEVPKKLSAPIEVLRNRNSFLSTKFLS